MKPYTAFIHAKPTQEFSEGKFKPDHYGFECETEEQANRIIDRAMKDGALGGAVLQKISDDGKTMRFRMIRKEGDINLG
ncbi:MAG: hypothetical protein IJG38_00130 [Thermoguttaceae bacterium]|nr:hypothetical protein [Thermoguttaceae bacterium]MBQ3348782.1 hypothetical protein [Thermoguttaceae bacterium]